MDSVSFRVFANHQKRRIQPNSPAGSTCFNFGLRAERSAMRPPEKDWPINILEGAVRSGKTWSLHPKVIYCCDYNIGGRKLITGVSKQSIYNNVLTDLVNIVGPRNYSYNRNT